MDFSLIFRGIGGLFVDFSWNWWIFRGIGGFFLELVDFLDRGGEERARMLQGCSKDAPGMLRGC